LTCSAFAVFFVRAKRRPGRAISFSSTAGAFCRSSGVSLCRQSCWEVDA
jgi:hypothetical protein